MFEYTNEQFERSKCENCMGGGGIQFVRFYTPLYEKGIKKTQIKSMETTQKFPPVLFLEVLHFIKE